MKTITKIISCAAAAAVLIPNIAFVVSADETQERVRILIENNTFSAADGAAWEGTLLDEWVTWDGKMSAAELFENTLTEKGYTQTGASDNYVTEINGLTAQADAAKMGGWMTGLDDWYGNGGIATLNLESGDEIIFSYSLNWGADIGSDYTSTSTKLLSVVPDKGQLSPEFSSDITEYVLTLPTDADSVKITPTAENKSFRYKIYKNEYLPEDATADYKRTESIPVKNGDVIYVGVGHGSWHSYMPEGAEETVYKITVKGGSTTASDTDKESDNDTSSDITVPDKQNDFSDITVEAMVSVLHKGLTPKDNDYLPGDEWVLLTNCRLGLCSEKDADSYLAKLAETLKSDPPKRPTDYAKYTLVLTSLGKDASDWNGTDMTAALADLDFITKQGINASAYSLLALDSNNYAVPLAESGKEQTTRKELISELMGLQLKDGGWAFFGDTYEPDMTGIVLQALSPYYGKDPDVTKAVDHALDLLSEKQNDDGTYTSYGEPNCENSAQIIIALSALGIDADKDDRFIKPDGSALDGLKKFWLPDENGFSHALNAGKNGLASVQSYEALCAYQRFVNNQTALFDMTDVKTSTATDFDNQDGNSSSSKTNTSSTSTSNSQTTVTTTQVTTTVETGDKGYGAILMILLISSAAVVLNRKKDSSVE